MRFTPLLGAAACALVLHCGGSDSAGAGADDGTAGNGACDAPAEVTSLSKCIDGGKSPSACLSASKASACRADVDGDGLDDALEDAMLRSYAPVFAYNKSNGDHSGGDSESVYPTNAAHYVAHASLFWRVDDDDSTKKLVDDKPTLDKLPGETFTVSGAEKHADETKLGEGPNFWLCLDKSKDTATSQGIVDSVEVSRSLDQGIDLLAVAHPTATGGDYIALEYMLFYPYNQFTLDSHEGDFEGGAVFVSLETGKVSSFFTDRHPTADGFKLIPLEGDKAVDAKDPRADKPRYNICSDTDSGDSSGVRFWDYDGQKHHPVIYSGGGSHASYAYPGATKIKGVGCIEQTMIRDVHNGEGPKLVPSENVFYTDWVSGAKPITTGVHIQNLGEHGHLRAKWSAFAGQWGCTLDSIPKSYPGPWDNERLCRHWLTTDWGAAPPFKLPTVTSCKE